MNISKILVVDDEEDMLEVCRDILVRIPNTSVVTEQDAERALEILRAESFDVVIVDLMMPKLSGTDFLKKAREIDANILAIIVTGFPTVETAVESVKQGAFDYLVKPFSPDQLQITASRAIEHRNASSENRFLTRHLEKDYKFDDMVGISPRMLEIYDAIQKVAVTDWDVLLSGESGTGKELIARSIHSRSRRKDARFVPVDCGAIPEQLLESEFFGFEKGAFTGAVRSQLGLAEFADRGTLFLDEICELAPLMQAKLLRILQEHTFRRIGGKQEIRTDIRIIAATNRAIESEVKEGRFREDLYYRISVIRMRVPPLRERREDIPHLMEHFFGRFASEAQKNLKGIDDEAMEVLLRYPWRGNVRELQNVLKRAILIATGTCVTIDDLPDSVVCGIGESPAARLQEGFLAQKNRQIEKFEQEYLTDLLTRFNGDVAAAAKEADLPRGTLYRLLKKHNIPPESFRK